MSTNTTRQTAGRTRRLPLLVMALIAATVALMLALPASAFAYDYKVRVFGGNDWGNGATTEPTNMGVIANDEVAYGGFYKLSKSDAQAKLPEDSKYYVKGFRVAGEDRLCDESYPITEDTDFVVAYGVKGRTVTYTVRYVERGTGRALTGSDSGRSSVTYEGNVGDKPVVPYEFIRGYRPIYRNITKTLVADSSKNVFTFEYVPLAEGENEDGTTTSASTGSTGATGTAPAATATAPSATATTPSATGTDSGTTNDENGDENDNAASTTPATPVPATTEPPATQQLSDEDNPLANGTDQTGSTGNQPGATEGEESGNGGVPVIAIFAIAAAIVAAIAAIIYFLRRRAGLEALGDDAEEAAGAADGEAPPGQNMGL